MNIGRAIIYAIIVYLAFHIVAYGFEQTTIPAGELPWWLGGGPWISISFVMFSPLIKLIGLAVALVVFVVTLIKTKTITSAHVRTGKKS